MLIDRASMDSVGVLTNFDVGYWTEFVLNGRIRRTVDASRITTTKKVSARRAGDFLVYMVIALALAGGTTWYADSHYERTDSDVFMKWGGLAMNTLLILASTSLATRS
jgi:hypothetical protein